MATDATFDNQLQALATATANYANGKDAAIKNTIITALGGSTQAGGSADITLTVNGDNYEGVFETTTIPGGVRIGLGGIDPSEEEEATYNDGYIDVTY